MIRKYFGTVLLRAIDDPFFLFHEIPDVYLKCLKEGIGLMHLHVVENNSFCIK